MILLTISIILIVIFTLLCFIFYFKYKNILNQYNELNYSIHKKFIKKDFKLQNAVFQAYSAAIEKRNFFQAQKFKELIKEFQRER